VAGGDGTDKQMSKSDKEIPPVPPEVLSQLWTPHEILLVVPENGKKVVQNSRIPRTKEPFVILPETHLMLLASLKSPTAFAVYGVLYLTWCGSPKKYNPVKLNAGKLRGMGCDSRAVRRALNALERLELIRVTRKPGNSPTVFLQWKEKRGCA
jgi:hypothetical protein